MAGAYAGILKIFSPKIWQITGVFYSKTKQTMQKFNHYVHCFF
jgi:hypothetical protein